MNCLAAVFNFSKYSIRPWYLFCEFCPELYTFWCSNVWSKSATPRYDFLMWIAQYDKLPTTLLELGYSVMWLCHRKQGSSSSPLCDKWRYDLDSLHRQTGSHSKMQLPRDYLNGLWHKLRYITYGQNVTEDSMTGKV